MAMQLFPILLVGGGAAYMYKKQKDKSRKRKGLDCPPENTVTIGEMGALAAQISSRFKDEPDPFIEANYAIEHLLSKHCNKNSKNSRVKIQVSNRESFDISVPDLYMLILSNSTGIREDKGMITEDQARAVQAKAFEWYKNTTGKPFDPSSLGLEKFAQALAVAMMEAIQKGSKNKKAIPDSNCPDRIVIDLSDTRKEMITASINGYISGGGKNPFTIVDDIFNQLMPNACRKGDFRTTVELRHDGQLFKTYNATSFYVAIALDVMEEMVNQGAMTQQSAMQAYNDLKANYKQLTGEELPPNLN